jgi:hypothetical protein
MRRLIVETHASNQLYELNDPNGPSESEFEYAVVNAFSRIFRQFRCVVFGGSFLLDDRVYRPDIALVAKDMSHWFVVEVELVTHSLERHVLPQVRAFRYGEPQEDCKKILARALNISSSQASTLLALVPRTVAVVSNKRNLNWDIALKAHDVQSLTVSVFSSSDGSAAYEVDGNLEILNRSVGFGIFSMTDRSIRFPSSTQIPEGRVQILDPEGAPSWWQVTRSPTNIWVTKESGVIDVTHESHVQLIKTMSGQLSLRRLAS